MARSSRAGLPELTALDDLEEQETRSIGSARSQDQRRKASETRPAAASPGAAAMPKLNLGRNMAVMNKMLEKQAVKGASSARKSRAPAASGSSTARGGGQLALINERGSFASDSSLDTAEMAARRAQRAAVAPPKKEKKTVEQMRAELGGKDRDYDAGKQATKLHAEVELTEVEIKQCKRLVDRRRPNPLASYTNRDFLKMFVVNNLALLIVGFFFSANIYSISPVSGGFSATHIRADNIRVTASAPEDATDMAHQTSFVSTTADSSLVLQGSVSATIAYGQMESAETASTPSYEMSARAGTLQLTRRVHDGARTELVSFEPDEMRINAGLAFDADDPERTPDRLVKVSDAGGAVSLGGSLFMMPQGILGNGSVAFAPQSGHHVFVRPVGDAAMRIHANMSIAGSLRVGKDLQSDEPCARGVTMLVDPEEQSVQFGSEFNGVGVHLDGAMMHNGDIVIQDGGVRMEHGDLTVANFDFSRARKASFMGRRVRLGIRDQSNEPRVDVRGHMQFLDADGVIYLSVNAAGLGYIQARNMIARNNTWLRGNVIIGGGKRDPMAGWVKNCDLQRRGGGTGSCDSATDYRRKEEPGVLTVRAGHTSMVNIDAAGDVCIGQQCIETVNSTKPGLLTVVGNLRLSNDHGAVVGEVLPERASVFGRYSVAKGAHLRSGATLTGAQDDHASLRVVGPTISAGPVRMTDGTLRVVGRAGFANAHTLGVEIKQQLTVCNGMSTSIYSNWSAICQPRFIVDAASSSLWSSGSATVSGTTTLMQDVTLGATNTSHVETLGRAETMHALQAGSMELLPRVNHRVAWSNGTIEDTTYEMISGKWWSALDANYSVIDVYQRRGVQISASMTAHDFYVGPRLNRTYVDMAWQEQQGNWSRSARLSTFRVAGSSGMKTLTSTGLLRVVDEVNSTTLFAANPGAGDAMVHKSLTTRGHSIVNGAEFGPVQVFSYTIDFENASVYDWAVQEDPRCYMTDMPGHVCDMAQHWNQYECFSLWQQDSLSRTEKCTVQFNTTRADVILRVPLEEVYYKLTFPDEQFPEVAVSVPLEPPIFLRTLAPADTTIRASMHVNRSATLKATTVQGNAAVSNNVMVDGVMAVTGTFTAEHDMNVTGKLFSAHRGHLKFSVVPDSESGSGGGVAFTYGGLNVHGSGHLLQAVEFGESPVDTLQVKASSRFNNSLHTKDTKIEASLLALSPVSMTGNFRVNQNASMNNITIVGNMVFETDVYRTFIVEAWSRTATSSGSVYINNNGSMHVDEIVSAPSLVAESLYIVQVNGTTPAGTLIEGVTIVDGGITRPRVDELQAQYSEGILVDGVTCRSGTLSTFQAEHERTPDVASQARNATRRDDSLVSMVNSGHARYMIGTISSLAFFHHGHPSNALSGSELSHQSASLTVGTESDWNEVPESQNAYLMARTVSAGVLAERFRIRANGDAVFNNGLGEIVASTGQVFVRGDFRLIQRRAIVPEDPSGPILTGNQTGNETLGGNLTTISNTTGTNQTDVDADDGESDDTEIDPAFLVPKHMQVMSNESSVTASLLCGSNAKSSLQLSSAVGVFDLGFMKERQVVDGPDSCTTRYEDRGSILRIRGSQKELMSIGLAGGEAYVWSRGSASVCNASAESCGVSVLSAQEASVEVKSSSGDAMLTVQSGWSHRVRVSFVDAARNGRNSTFHLTASGSHICRDDFEWVDPNSGRNCRYYEEHDPGCVVTKSNPQLPARSDPLAACTRTCEMCDGGVPIPHLDIQTNDGRDILHIEDLGNNSFAQLHGDVTVGFCSARDHFGRCAATPRDVSLTVFSPSDAALVRVTSRESDASLRLVSGAFGAAGVTFAQPAATGDSSSLQIAKRQRALEFTNSRSKLLAKMAVATSATSSIANLYVSGSATFGSLTDTTHSVLVRSNRAAKCKVQSRSTAEFAVRAGYGRNASVGLVTPRTNVVQNGNQTLIEDAGVSQFHLINDGRGLTIQQKSESASGNSSRVRNVLSVVSTDGQGDLTFDGNGLFCSSDALGAAACGVRVESTGRAEVSVVAENGTSDVVVVPGQGSRAVLDLQTRPLNDASNPRVVRLWTNPADRSLVLSAGIDDKPMLTVQRVPSQTSLLNAADGVSSNSTNASSGGISGTHYGFVNVLGNGDFGINSTKAEGVALRSANSSRVLIGSLDGSANASAVLSVQSNTGAYLSLRRGSNSSVASEFSFVARTEVVPCDSRFNTTHNPRANDSQPCTGLDVQSNTSAAGNATTRLFLETGAWGVVSIEHRTVARHIQQHSIYQLTAFEFFCKVSYVQVVHNCAGSAPDPQAAWGSLVLRECTVPCYVNLMPWFSACGSQLNEFEELHAEQIGTINLQRAVCADYYGPYTGPATDVAMNALELFHDLEQTHGPFSANVSIGDTKVVQTRVQEIKANETAGLVSISCSVAFGLQQLDLSRRVSVETRGSAALRVQSTRHNASLKLRAGKSGNATISFIRSNDMPNRESLIVGAMSNESISTPETMHTSAVHRFEWVTAGNGTLDMLGFSVRRDDSSGSLLLPVQSDSPVSLFSIQNDESVGSISLGGSVSFGAAIEGDGGALFRTPDRQRRFTERAASLIDADEEGLTLVPVNQELCYSAGLGAFCQTGASIVTPFAGGSVKLDVELQPAVLAVPGGACQSTTDSTAWTFGPMISVAVNTSQPDGNITTRMTAVMDCPAGSQFNIPADIAQVQQISDAAEAALPQLASDAFAAAATFTNTTLTESLLYAAGEHDSALLVQSGDGAASVNVAAGPGKQASLFISSGARLPSVYACTSQLAKVDWNTTPFLHLLSSNNPTFDQNFTVSDSCHNFVQRAPRSTLKLSSGSASTFQLDAFTTESAASSLSFMSSTRALMAIESSANLTAGSAFHLRVAGNVAIGAQCPPNCLASSALQVLSPNSTSMNIAAQNGDARLMISSQDGSSSVIHLRQAGGSVFTLQHIGTHIELLHHTAAFSDPVASPYPEVDVPDDASTLLEIRNTGVRLTGTVSSMNLEVSASSTLGADVEDPALIAGSLSNLNLVVKPTWQVSNNTYNLTMTDPPRMPCADQDVTQYSMGDCQATLAYITQAGHGCFSNLNSYGISQLLSELCPLTCNVCPDASDSSHTIQFLPSVNNNPIASDENAAKVLTSVSTSSILMEVGTLTTGSIVEGFGSITTNEDIMTMSGGRITAAGTLSASGAVDIRGNSYLGGEIIEFYSFSSVAPLGVFTESVGIDASRVKLVSMSGSDKTTSLRGTFDPAILEIVEPTCPSYLNADGTVCVRGQRDIVVPDVLPDGENKEVMVIQYDYGIVNEVNQVYMSGTSGEIQSHPDQLIRAGRASYISVYNTLVKTTSIVLAQVSNTGVGGIVAVHAVTMMTVDGGFTITVRNIDPDHDMTTTYKVSYILFL